MNFWDFFWYHFALVQSEIRVRLINISGCQRFLCPDSIICFLSTCHQCSLTSHATSPSKARFPLIRGQISRKIFKINENVLSFFKIVLVASLGNAQSIRQYTCFTTGTKLKSIIHVLSWLLKKQPRVENTIIKLSILVKRAASSWFWPEPYWCRFNFSLPVHTIRRRNLKTKISLWKHIKCFPSTLGRWN